MAKVNLTVMKYEGKWTVRMEDGRAVQYLGATKSRSEIEAFAAKLMVDLIAEGDMPILAVDRASVINDRAAPHRGYILASIAERRAQ